MDIKDENPARQRFFQRCHHFISYSLASYVRRFIKFSLYT
jgi:hypothetical protein